MHILSCMSVLWSYIHLLEVNKDMYAVAITWLPTFQQIDMPHNGVLTFELQLRWIHSSVYIVLCRLLPDIKDVFPF